MSDPAPPWWKEPTRGQWLSFGAAWLGWVLDGFDFCLYLMANSDIAAEFGISITTTSWSLALTMLVRLVGGLLAGAAADRWGRKLPLMISIIWFAACNGAVAFAPTFFWVLALRTLFGLGMGAEWTAGATLAMENWPQRSRGIASGILQGSWGVGYLLAALAYRLVMPHFGWRGLFLVGAIPALLVLPIRFWVPESPEWLARKARGAAAAVAAAPRPSLRGLVPALVWGSAAMVFIFCAYYAVVGQYSTLLARELHLRQEQVADHAMLLNAGMLIGGGLCGVLMTRFGMRAAITVMMGCMLALLPLFVGRAPDWLWAGAFLGGLFGTGFVGVSPLLVTRLFPSDVRARAAGLVYHMGAIGSAFVVPGIAWLSESGGYPFSTSIMIFAVTFEVGLILCFWLQPRSLRAPEPAPLATP